MDIANRFFHSGPVAVICLFLLSSLLFAETLTYREVEGAIIVTHTLTVSPELPGFRVALASQRKGGGVVSQTFRVAADLSALAWTFSDPGRQMELDAKLLGEDIVLSGTFRGKKVEKKFSAAGPPWNQLFQVGLAPFALAKEKKFQFRSIGTQGPGELKIGKFTVTRKDDETINLGGKEVTAVHLRIALSGLLSIFWHGDYWYQKNDGRFLRYRGVNKPGGPLAISELVRENVSEAK
jgi:hypothetical protein